jgi:hypothetical protein
MTTDTNTNENDAYQFIEDNLEKYEGKIKALKDVCIRKNQLSWMLEDYHQQKLKVLNKK